MGLSQATVPPSLGPDSVNWMAQSGQESCCGWVGGVAWSAWPIESIAETGGKVPRSNCTARRAWLVEASSEHQTNPTTTAWYRREVGLGAARSMARGCGPTQRVAVRFGTVVLSPG